MGKREWGILIRSHDELRQALDVIDDHNQRVSLNPHSPEIGERLRIHVVLRMDKAVYIATGNGGGSANTSAFLHRHLPLEVLDPFEKPACWDDIRSYLWANDGYYDTLRDAAAPGTNLHAQLQAAYADPTPTYSCPRFFAGDAAARVSARGESFSDIRALSKRYLSGEGRSLIHKAPATEDPDISPSLEILKDLTDLGFAFVSITRGESTPTSRSRASVKFLCRDSDARDVCGKLFNHPSLAAHAQLSTTAVINNLPCEDEDGDTELSARFTVMTLSANQVRELFPQMAAMVPDGPVKMRVGADAIGQMGGNPLSTLYCPLRERAAGTGRNVRWTAVDKIKHAEPVPVGTILRKEFGFQNPRKALTGVALLTVVGTAWGEPAEPVATQVLNLVQEMRKKAKKEAKK